MSFMMNIHTRGFACINNFKSTKLEKVISGLYIYLLPPCSKVFSTQANLPGWLLIHIQISREHELGHVYIHLYIPIYIRSPSSLRLRRTASSVPLSIRVSLRRQRVSISPSLPHYSFKWIQSSTQWYDSSLLS